MKPIRLTMQNFLSYRGEHIIDFSGINLAVLSGPNGAGKSSLIDAIRFSIFGHTRGGLDGVITEGEQNCRVEFAFALGDENYLVSRSRSRKGSGSTLLSFQSNGQVLDGKSVAETQAKIEHTLRLTDDLFTVTACANQGNAAVFSQAKPAERKAVLGEILDLAAWERRAERARQIGKSLAAESEAKTGLLEQAQQKAAGREELAHAIREAESLLASCAEMLKEREMKIGELQAKREEILRARESHQAQLRQLQEIEERLRRQQTQVAEAKERLAKLGQAAVRKPEMLEALRKAEEAHAYAQELEAKRQEDAKLSAEGRLAEEQGKAARRQWETEIAALQQAITTAEREYQQELKTLADKVDSEKRLWDQGVQNLQKEVATLQRQAHRLEEVPCSRDSALIEQCPLIADAREARAVLPEQEKRLAEFEAARPWKPTENQLLALKTGAGIGARPPAAQERQRLAELQAADPSLAFAELRATRAKQRAQLGYDAAAHAQAKQQAGRLAEFQSALADIGRAEAQTEEAKANLERLVEEAAETDGQAGALRESLAAAPDWVKGLAEADMQIDRQRKKIAELQQGIRDGEISRATLQERLRAAEEAEKEAERLQTELKELARRLKLLNLLGNPRDGAFSKGGIPALLIERAIPDLEAVANDVLATLSDGRMSLQLLTQRETKGKNLQETLDIIIADGSASLTTGERGERPYENFSGGEAMRVDLALRIALSVLLASRAGARCELLILDETAAPLDAHGRGLFVECLSRVADRFATILCITHVEELKDLFPHRFEVSKDANGSHVNLVAT